MDLVDEPLLLGGFLGAETADIGDQIVDELPARVLQVVHQLRLLHGQADHAGLQVLHHGLHRGDRGTLLDHAFEQLAQCLDGARVADLGAQLVQRHLLQSPVERGGDHRWAHLLCGGQALQQGIECTGAGHVHRGGRWRVGVDHGFELDRRDTLLMQLEVGVAIETVEQACKLSARDAQQQLAIRTGQ